MEVLTDMPKILKIGSIFLLSVFGALLLLFFLVHNFPYETAMKRLDHMVAERYGAHIRVGHVKHRFPLRLNLSSVRVKGGDGSFTVQLEDLFLRLGFVGFSRLKTLEIGGRGLSLSSDYVTLSKSSFHLLSRFRLELLSKAFDDEFVDYVSCSLEGTKVERASLSGIEFSPFSVPLIELVLKRKNQYLNVERGTARSDLFVSEIAGTLDSESVDLTIGIDFTPEFQRQYGQLTELINSISTGGKLKIIVQGDPAHPQVRLVR